MEKEFSNPNLSSTFPAHHEWLLSDAVDILPFLLLPLAGPEELTEEENDGEFLFLIVTCLFLEESDEILCFSVLSKILIERQKKKPTYLTNMYYVFIYCLMHLTGIP